MKQGTGRSMDGGRKMEPAPKAVNPGAVADLGVHSVRTRSEPLYAGRGYTAPTATSTSHKSGTQGKH